MRNICDKPPLQVFVGPLLQGQNKDKKSYCPR